MNVSVRTQTAEQAAHLSAEVGFWALLLHCLAQPALPFSTSLPVER